MTKYYDTYSKEETERIQNDAESSGLFDLKISACQWFFPQLTRIVASSVPTYSKKKFHFNIYVTGKHEVSVLRYLAAFIVMHKRMGQANDSVLFVMPEDAGEKELSEIYGKISRFLTLFYEGNQMADKLYFSKLPSYTKPYIDNNLLQKGQLWLYERGGFGTTGIPLIPLDASIYKLLQKNINDFLNEDRRRNSSSDSWRRRAAILTDKSQSDFYSTLKAVVIREICKDFRKKFSDIKNDETGSHYKNTDKVLSMLDNADVLTFLLFGAAFWGIYNPQDGYKTVSMRNNILYIDNFITLFERCAAYSLGILQLIENTVSYTVGGFLSLRRIKRSSSYLKDRLQYGDDNIEDFINISICDIAELNNDLNYLDIVEKFIENLKDNNNEPSVNAILENRDKIKIEDLIFPHKESDVLKYLSVPENTGYHYGLQIFASAVEGAEGDFTVASGNSRTSSSTSLSLKTENKYIRDRYETQEEVNEYFCGTQFDILLPISGVIQSTNLKKSYPIPHELTFEALPEIYPQEVDIECNKVLATINKTLISKEKFFGERGLFVNEKRKWAQEIINNIKKVCYNNQPKHELQPLQINFDANLETGVVTTLFIEVLAKGIFFLLASDDFQYKNVVLSGFKNHIQIITFIRYYAQFYDRFGYNHSKAQHSQIMLLKNGNTNSIYATLSGKYIGKPLYDHPVFSGRGNGQNPEDELIELALEKIGMRTTNNEDNYSHTGISNNPHCFDNVTIIYDCEKIKRWKADLKGLVRTDFSHEKYFGVKIHNCVTHMHISGVHVDSFYQIDQIFTNAYWSKMIGQWLTKLVNCEGRDIILYGYGHLIEPVLIDTQKNLSNCEYIIYNEGYHYTAEHIAQSSLRYSCDTSKIMDILRNKPKIVFIMPISTTMGTYKRMATELDKKIGNHIDILDENNIQFVAVFQLIADNNRSMKVSNDYFKINNNEGYTNASKSLIDGVSFGNEKIESLKHSYYLLTLPSMWRKCGECEYCYPSANQFERMLYSTDDTSLVPTMQLHVFNREDGTSEKQENHFKPLDFFEKDSDNNYIYGSCLFYSHIERNEHFAHYIKTEALLDKILGNRSFYAKAQEIKGQLNIDNGIINVIVAPSHKSNQKLPSLINNTIFDGKAHIISVNAKKIYRSNFEAEFSNYTYLVAQLKNFISNNDKKQISDFIRFFYVDDHINTAHTYSRMKSLIKSLFRFKDDKNKHIYDDIEFSAVITLIDRHSIASRSDYINNTEKFFAFFTFNVPSVRKHGDSCPLCKQVATDKLLELRASLDSTAEICAQRRETHKVHEISEASLNFEELASLHPETCRTLTNRHMRRFEAENILWDIVCKAERNFRQGNTPNGLEYLNSLYSDIVEGIKDKIENVQDVEKIEYLISFFKVLPRPFLSYRPFVATAAINILRNFCNYLIDLNIDKSNNIAIKLSSEMINENINKQKDKDMFFSVKVDKTFTEEMESLLIVCLTGLATLNSTYILDTEKIVKIISFYNKLVNKYPDIGNSIFEPINTIPEQSNMRSFADYLRFSVFRIVHHEKFGEIRREKFDNQLINALRTPISEDTDTMFFLVLLYLENSYAEETNELSDAINCLYEEIINNNYDEKHIMDFDNVGRILAESMAYINEKDLDNKASEDIHEPLTLTPITTRGYHNAFDIGFYIHFLREKQYMPITSALNKETNQLWGKITLSNEASNNLNRFGINIYCSPKDIGEGKYIFIKFSNSNELFMPETGDNEKIVLPKMPPLYLRIDINKEQPPLEILKSLRIIISQRAYILQKFAKDLSSDDMNRLIAERRSTRALSITKASKHATERSERLMIYDFEQNDKLDEKLIGQVRRLLANRTVSGLYQTESILFEQENRKKFNDDLYDDVIYDYRCLSLWSQNDDKDQYTQIWSLLKQGFAIYGNEEVDSSCKIRLTFDIDESVKPDKRAYLLKYESFQEDNLTLDFIFLFANNAIRHADWRHSKDDMKFKISIEGNFLVMRSSIGVPVDIDRRIRTVRAIAIPPNVRKSLCESGSCPNDTDGITLWSVARYFRRLQNYFKELSNSDDKSIILPVNVEDNCMTAGYEYFNISYEENGESCDFVVRLKCIESKEEA